MDNIIYQSIVIGLVVGITGAISYRRALKKRQLEADKETSKQAMDEKK